MSALVETLSRPWPWWIAGPAIGLVVPLLLFGGGKVFGLSSNLRHLCAATVPGRIDFFRYDWRREGGWNLTFALGIVLGGFVAGTWLASPDPAVAVSAATVEDLRALGLADLTGLVPRELVSWQALGTLPGLVVVVVGGFLVGFGARWAGGCTSGHAVSGLGALQLPSLLAVAGFFAGGLVATHLLLPPLLGMLP